MAEKEKKQNSENHLDFVGERSELKKSGVPAKAGNSRHNLPMKEIGGQAGPDPTRYGDWEKGGRCTDF